MNVVGKGRNSYLRPIPSRAVAQVRAVAPSDQNLPIVIRFDYAWKLGAMLCQLLGAVLIFSAALMWVVPGSHNATDLVMIKLGASFLMLFGGIAILMLSHSDNRPDAYFDPVRREVRVLQKTKSGRPETVLRRSFDSLGSARFCEKTLTLYDVDGSLLMRLRLDSADTRHALRQVLIDNVTIAS